MTLRERIIEFVKEKYKSEPEYLWNRLIIKNGLALL